MAQLPTGSSFPDRLRRAHVPHWRSVALNSGRWCPEGAPAQSGRACRNPFSQQRARLFHFRRTLAPLRPEFATSWASVPSSFERSPPRRGLSLRAHTPPPLALHGSSWPTPPQRPTASVPTRKSYRCPGSLLALVDLRSHCGGCPGSPGSPLRLPESPMFGFGGGRVCRPRRLRCESYGGETDEAGEIAILREDFGNAMFAAHGGNLRVERNIATCRAVAARLSE